MAYIFLDFDGVLNSDAFYTRNSRAAKVGDVDPRAVRCLNELCRRSGAYVVISSSWRHDTSITELRDILSKRGFMYPKKVIGKTPDFGENAIRGYEILGFLKGKRALKKPFVVLDDTEDMDGVHEYFVKTHPKIGLRMSDVEKALAVLAKGGVKVGKKTVAKKSRRRKRKAPVWIWL